MGVSIATRTGSKRVRSLGNRKETVTDVTFDNSYAEGGEELTARQLGLAKVAYAYCHMLNGSESEEFVAWARYDESTSKIRLFSAKTGKEIVKEKDMSKVVVRVRAVGV